MLLSNSEKIESLMIGDYKIIQSSELYRFTSDAVYLSRFATANKGETVADICSGSGIVGLHFYALNEKKVKSVHLFELQTPLAEMSKKSIELNGLEKVFTVSNVAIQNVDESLYNSFSLVTCNPPYKKKESGITSENESLALCKHEISVTLDDISECAFKLLKRGGRIVLCNKCERLADVIISFKKFNLSPSRLKFIVGAENSSPYLFFIEAYKGVQKQLKVEKQAVNSSTNFSGE